MTPRVCPIKGGMKHSPEQQVAKSALIISLPPPCHKVRPPGPPPSARQRLRCDGRCTSAGRERCSGCQACPRAQPASRTRPGAGTWRQRCFRRRPVMLCGTLRTNGPVHLGSPCLPIRSRDQWEFGEQIVMAAITGRDCVPPHLERDASVPLPTQSGGPNNSSLDRLDAPHLVPQPVYASYALVHHDHQ